MSEATSSAKHEYPANAPPPGAGDWLSDIAWKVLDTLPPGRLTIAERALLVGKTREALLYVMRKQASTAGWP